MGETVENAPFSVRHNCTHFYQFSMWITYFYAHTKVGSSAVMVPFWSFLHMVRSFCKSILEEIMRDTWAKQSKMHLFQYGCPQWIGPPFRWYDFWWSNGFERYKSSLTRGCPLYLQVTSLPQTWNYYTFLYLNGFERKKSSLTRGCPFYL